MIQPNRHSIFCQPAVILVILALATAALYYPALHGQFTFLDDNTFIVENPHLTPLDLDHIRMIFTQREVGHYHPVTSLLYALEIHFFGLTPFIFHLVNLLLHIINIVLVYLLIHALFSSSTLGLFTSFFFAVHPMMVEPVAWAAGTSTLLFSCFYLTGLILYAVYLKTTKRYLLVVTFLLFLLSVLCKSAAISFPAALILLQLQQRRKPAILHTIPFFILSVAAVWLALQNAQTIGTAGAALNQYTLTDRFFMVNYAAGYYLTHLFWPFKQSALHFNPAKVSGMLPAIYYWATCLTPALLLLIYLIIKKGIRLFANPLFFGMAFFLTTIGVYLQIYPIGQTIVSERYFYLPATGLILAAGYAVQISPLSTKKSILLVVAVLLYASALAYKTRQRLPVWHDNFSLWQDVTIKYPQTYYGYYGLACSYYTEGDFHQASQYYRETINLNPTFSDAFLFYGKSLIETENYHQAIEPLSQAVRLKHRNLSEVYELRAGAYRKAGLLNKAIQDWSQFILLEPASWKAYNQRAQLKLETRDTTGAIGDWSSAIDIYPGNLNGLFNRALTYIHTGSYNLAVADLNKILAIKPADAQAAYIRAIALLKMNGSSIETNE